jgi:hypothetical protein
MRGGCLAAEGTGAEIDSLKIEEAGAAQKT